MKYPRYIHLNRIWLCSVFFFSIDVSLAPNSSQKVEQSLQTFQSEISFFLFGQFEQFNCIFSSNLFPRCSLLPRDEEVWGLYSVVWYCSLCILSNSLPKNFNWKNKRFNELDIKWFAPHEKDLFKTTETDQMLDQSCILIRVCLVCIICINDRYEIIQTLINDNWSHNLWNRIVHLSITCHLPVCGN